MKATLPVKTPRALIEAHVFSAADLIGGDAAIDFVNTVTGRDETPRDWLDSYSRLIDWAMLTELLPARTLRALRKRADRSPAAADEALERAKVLRETLFEVLTAIATGGAPSKQGLALLRSHWIDAAAAHELRYESGKIAIVVQEDARDLDLIASMAAYRMVAVLSGPLDRLRMCAGPNCSWLFLDSSKSGRRRWCDMAVCGNAAKARRFHSRTTRMHQ